MSLRMADTKCGICGESNGKYSCPRCNVSYCSVSCYRSEKHLECSETFYKNWVQEELKNCEADPEAKRRMLEILKQSQENDSSESLDSDDDEDEPDLATRMSGINLDDDEAVWEKLTAEEKKEFRKLVASGNIIKIIPEWEPWWKIKKKKTLIQDCQEEEFVWKSVCPPVLSDITKLSQLTTSSPSPTIPFMLVNILSSYAFTVRWFKGTHKDLAVEAISTCIALSATLRDNKVFNNCIEAFSTFEEDLSKCEWAKEAEYDKNVIGEDIMDIAVPSNDINDPFFCVKAALSDLESLISVALNILKEAKNQQLRRFSGAPPKSSSLKLLSKKMIFYLAWTVEHGSLLTATLANFSY